MTNEKHFRVNQKLVKKQLIYWPSSTFKRSKPQTYSLQNSKTVKSMDPMKLTNSTTCLQYKMDYLPKSLRMTEGNYIKVFFDLHVSDEKRWSS